MARCGRCSTNNHQELYSFGGVNVCFSCYDAVNPQTYTYKRLSNFTREHYENKISFLKSELRRYEHMIEIDNRLIESGEQTLTTVTPRE
jgi:hypothetical protein